jgi:hypothetical protein
MPETPARPGEIPAPLPRRPLTITRFRVDGGSDAGSDLAPGCGSLLRAFGTLAATKPVSTVQDRRAELRHNTVECLAWVGWKVWREFKMKDALVVNISRSGAQIFVDAPPPADRPVWLYLETPREKTIVKARVQSLTTTAAGQCAAHVSFLEPCPYAFFEAAVCGMAPSDPKTRSSQNSNGAKTPPRRRMVD